MIRHYLKIALRSLSRQKGLAFINIIGLSLGVACFLLFLLYAVNEFSYDRFHSNAPNLYRAYLWYDGVNDNPPSGTSYLPMPLGPALKREFPDVERTARLREAWGENFVQIGEKTSRVGLSYADPELLTMFSFPLKWGDPNTALKDLHGMVITEATSEKLFGKINPLGRTISVKAEDSFVPFTITGVARNIPSNSSIRFDMLASFGFLETTASGKGALNNWHRSAYQTFVQLRPGSRLPEDRARFLAFRKKYSPEEEEEAKKKGWKGESLPIWYGLQPIATMHTDMRFGDGPVPAVDPKTIWILLGIATGVLLIACINFTTLAIGRSAGRSREVGVRKVIGGTRRSLILQFLSEALLLSILSACIGLGIAGLLLPYFNRLSDRDLQFSFERYPQLLWMGGLLVLAIGILAGSYPALVLSRFRPIEVLKTKIRLGGSNLFTRSLVTLQFILSAGLIICTLVILKQLHYMRGKNPGFNKENVIVVDADGLDTKELFPRFRQQLSGVSEVLSVAGAEIGLGEGSGWSMSGFEYGGKHKQIFEYFIDSNYLSTLGITLLAGRNFQSDLAQDTTRSVIINESMMRDFGWNLANAVGQELTGYSENLTPVVIGVVKDFNFRPLKEEVKPQLFHQFASYQPYKFFVRIRPGYPAQALGRVEAAWKRSVPGYPFKYSFLDENISRFYHAEARWSSIVGWAGGISIFLACLGLLGLTMLAIVNRTKEIGIRKVLGASLSHIIRLISKDFLKLVLLAFIIASPLAWYFMNKWLQDFAYRIQIGWTVFLLSGAAALAIAFGTISFQAVKAGLANPVRSLRDE